MSSDLPETATYNRAQVLASALIGIIVTFLVGWWASGTAVFYEELFRVAPTVAGGGVGTDWVAGNTTAWLDFLIAITHAADVIMGVFILLMVFIHWGAFRRLADRMGESADEEPVVIEGGEADD